jgi:hypothetical protein
MTSDRRTEDLVRRIEQLGQKSTQVLIFLSFAFLATVTLKADRRLTLSEQGDLTHAMRWWSIALPLVLLQVLPVRDVVDYAESWNKARYYELIRWLKVALLIVAVASIIVGASYFARNMGLHVVGYSDGWLS